MKASLVLNESAAVSRLDAVIERARTTWNNVGVSVAVVHEKEVVYAYSAGMRRVGDDLPIDERTLFQIGSLTKAFTAAAVGIAASEQSLDFDTPVAEIIPGLHLGDEWLTHQISLRDLLAHRAGLSVNIYPYLAPFDESRALEQLKFLRPQEKFRDCFQYDNLMYALAGKAVEVLSGDSWQRFVQSRILEPLGMRRSGTSTSQFWRAGQFTPTFMGTEPDKIPHLADALDPNVAMPHGFDGAGNVVPLAWQGYDNTAAAGSIVSSSADMANWLILHLNGGAYAGSQIIPVSAFEQLHAPQNLRTAAGRLQFLGGDKSYALGWERARYKEHRFLAHGGGIIGFPAFAAMLPDLGLGVIILSNGPKIVAPDYTLEQLFHKAVAMEVFDSFLGGEKTEWIGSLAELYEAGSRTCEREETRLRSSRIAGTHPTAPLGDLPGTYVDRAGNSGDVTVRLDGTELHFNFAGDGGYSARLDHWHGDMFRMRQSPSIEGVLGAQFVTFVIDAYGDVTGLRAFGDYGGFFERRRDSAAGGAA